MVTQIFHTDYAPPWGTLILKHLMFSVLGLIGCFAFCLFGDLRSHNVNSTSLLEYFTTHPSELYTLCFVTAVIVNFWLIILDRKKDLVVELVYDSQSGISTFTLVNQYSSTPKYVNTKLSKIEWNVGKGKDRFFNENQTITFSHTNSKNSFARLDMEHQIWSGKWQHIIQGISKLEYYQNQMLP